MGLNSLYRSSMCISFSLLSLFASSSSSSFNCRSKCAASRLMLSLKKRERKKENEEEGNEAITSLHTEPAWALDRLLRANVLAGRELRERKKRTAEDVLGKKKSQIYTKRHISSEKNT